MAAGPTSVPLVRGRRPSRRRRNVLRVTQVVVTDSFAGTERYVCDVSLELACRGHDVQVIGGAPGDMADLLRGAVAWKAGGRPSDVLRALATGGRRDIVHTHLTKADFAAFLSAPATGGRRVSTRHILAPRGYRPSAQRFGRFVRGRLAQEIAVSAYVAKHLDPPADVVLLNGVPAVEGEPASADRSTTVLVAQRLECEKGTALALRAWARSGLGERGWRLSVAGRGPEEAELRALAKALDVAGTVDFVGFVADLSAELRRAAILLAPAPAEPLGLSVLEAMARGVPVVAADAAGHRETVGRDPAAALFAVGDASGCAGQLQRLADDPQCRLDYGRRLQALQRRYFTIEDHVDQLLALYRGVLR